MKEDECEVIAEIATEAKVRNVIEGKIFPFSAQFGHNAPLKFGESVTLGRKVIIMQLDLAVFIPNSTPPRLFQESAERDGLRMQ
jgi:hypothetical protein